MGRFVGALLFARPTECAMLFELPRHLLAEVRRLGHHPIELIEQRAKFFRGADVPFAHDPRTLAAAGADVKLNRERPKA